MTTSFPKRNSHSWLRDSFEDRSLAQKQNYKKILCRCENIKLEQKVKLKTSVLKNSNAELKSENSEIVLYKKSFFFNFYRLDFFVPSV